MDLKDNETEQVGSSSNSSDFSAGVYLIVRLNTSTSGVSSWFF